MFDDPFGDDAWGAPDQYFEAGASLASPSIAPEGSTQPPEEDTAAAFARREEERKSNRDSLYERLNTEQHEAVFMPHESALVLAAAGSGKTSVLTARVARLVTDGAPTVQASDVMAVTFTNKASQEMKHRLRALLNKSAVNELWVGTFHSLCNRILRENYAAAGLPKAFAILDTDGQESLVRNILKDFGLTKASIKEAKKLASLIKPETDLLSAADPLAKAGEPARSDEDDEDVVFVTPKQCVNHINAKKERGKKPEVITTVISVTSPDAEQMEAVFGEYQARMDRQGLLDFQDLLTRAVELLRSNKEVREEYQGRFKAILVDEFQDTNDIQFEWLTLMKGPKCHVTAVGDDDQSIYAFRGADPRNMGRFLKHMAATPAHPKGRMIRLEQNYRSLPHILEAANAIIERNTNRLGKVLRTSKADTGDAIDLVTYGNGHFEASSIASKIYERIKTDGVSPSEVAVLYRTNMQSRALEQELNKLGVPLTVYGGFRFYERQEIKNVMAYLDLVADISRDLSFVRVANFPPRGIGERTLEDLRQQAQGDRISMIEMVDKRVSLMEANPGSIGNAAAQKKLRQLHAFSSTILDLADAAVAMPLSRLIESLVEKTGIAKHYADEGAGSKSSEEEAKERMDNIAELISAARQFELEHPDLQFATEQLPEYLSFVALMTSTSESDMSKKNTVSLMTVHSSKGLEFDHVYIAGLEEGVFPHNRAITEDEERGNGRSLEEGARMLYVGGIAQDQYVDQDDGPGLQEERRLMYVALTRARKTLTLSHALERMSNGESREAESSRFLAELPDHRLNRLDDRQEPTAPKANRFRNHEVQAPMMREAESPSAPAAKADGAGRRIAVIGTAGRDKSETMNRVLWDAMVADLRSRVGPDDILVSGGAAWADHLAVHVYLQGHVKGLELHLPAPFDDIQFQGPGQSSATAANYYHQRFHQATGINSLEELHCALMCEIQVTTEPAASGYRGMFARNEKVAKRVDSVIAYTFGEGDTPADGGTKNTWDQVIGQKVHVSLRGIVERSDAQLKPAHHTPTIPKVTPPTATRDESKSSPVAADLKPWQRRGMLSTRTPAASASAAPAPSQRPAVNQSAQPTPTSQVPSGVMTRLNMLSKGGGQASRTPAAQEKAATNKAEEEHQQPPSPSSGFKLPASARRYLRA
ncbi:UvrD-helicase domain-containing protein [Hydrogenophaga sp. 2FB]|uniref:ATP-dependent helicase n=1 Tax=Hydrogenophaga sp. 2FB TaxID=2502187 RepID=UPI001485BDE7|nr:UvrD-helicase domain-containing protein [Hydrogenophaga sp. 2FB]